MSDSEMHDLTERRLSAIEQRYTRGRRTLVGALGRADRPLTVEQVVELEASLPKSSVYRNLAVLEQAGVVRRIVSSDEFARYELAEELTEHHHHLICSECGSIDDFILSEEFEARVHDELDGVASRHGFAGDHHRLDLVGVCAGCHPR